MTAKHVENERIGSLYVEIKTDEEELGKLWEELEGIHRHMYLFIAPFPAGPGGAIESLHDWEHDDLNTKDIQSIITRMRTLDARIAINTMALNSMFAHGE